MTAPTLAVGDVCLFATSCRMTMQCYGIAAHRRDVAQLVATCTVTDVREDKYRLPLSIVFSDKSALVAVPNELTVIEKADTVAPDVTPDNELAPAGSMEAAA